MLSEEIYVEKSNLERELDLKNKEIRRIEKQIEKMEDDGYYDEKIYSSYNELALEQEDIQQRLEVLEKMIDEDNMN